MTFAFNFKFTREDEQHANEYHVGMNVEASNREDAEKILHARNAHLRILSVELFAVMNDDGDVLNVAQQKAYAAYERANEVANEAGRKLSQAQQAYRERKIGDAEFLAARQEWDLAMVHFDAAYATIQGLS